MEIEVVAVGAVSDFKCPTCKAGHNVVDLPESDGNEEVQCKNIECEEFFYVEVEVFIERHYNVSKDY